MAVDTKISDLNPVTTPDGTETAVIVKSSATKKITLANILQAGLNAVFGNLSVNANSSGNVARWVMNTAGGGTGDAGYFAKLATYTLSTANGTIDAIYELVGTNKTTAPICRFRVRIRNGTTGIDSTNTVVEILELSDEADISHNNFFITLATDGLGVNIELYVKKNTIYGKFYLTEVSLECEETYTVAYNNNAAWSATDPTSGAAVSKTSDWAGSGLITSTSLLNGWTGSITYEKLANGEVRGHLTVSGLGTIADGTNVFLMPNGYRVETGIGGANVSYKTTLVSGGSGGFFLFDATGNVKCYAINASATTGQTDEFTYMARN